MRSGTMLNEDGDEYVDIHPSIIKSFVGLSCYSPKLKESVEILRILMSDEKNPIFFCLDKTKEENNFHVLDINQITICCIL